MPTLICGTLGALGRVHKSIKVCEQLNKHENFSIIFLNHVRKLSNGKGSSIQNVEIVLVVELHEAQ